MFEKIQKLFYFAFGEQIFTINFGVIKQYKGLPDASRFCFALHLIVPSPPPLPVPQRRTFAHAMPRSCAAFLQAKARR
jgi:hypothetical protein